jgi:hypothetical protein
MKKTTRTYNRKNKNDAVIKTSIETVLNNIEDEKPEEIKVSSESITEKSSLELNESNLKTDISSDSIVELDESEDTKEQIPEEIVQKLDVENSLSANITLTKKDNNWTRNTSDSFISPSTIIN